MIFVIVITICLFYTIPCSCPGVLLQVKSIGSGDHLPFDRHWAIGSPERRRPSLHVSVNLSLNEVELYTALTFVFTDGLPQSIATIMTHNIIWSTWALHVQVVQYTFTLHLAWVQYPFSIPSTHCWSRSSDLISRTATAKHSSGSLYCWTAVVSDH